METKYPKYDVYEILYKRYFKRDVKELIDLGEILETDKVLDICGGNGRLTKKLIEINNNVSYLDQELDMIPEELSSLGVTVYNMSIQEFIKNPQEKYNKVFCQQAINYWLLDIDVELFSNIFEKDGVFIFNTFANKPTKEPMIKQYQIDDINFLEVSYLVGNKVHHIQVREDYAPHYTVFNWIDEETIRNILSPYFDIEVIRDKGTSIYKCRRY